MSRLSQRLGGSLALRVLTRYPKFEIGRRVRIEVLYCKGGRSEGVVEVDIHEETGDVHLAAPLVPARDARQAT